MTKSSFPEKIHFHFSFLCDIDGHLDEIKLKFLEEMVIGIRPISVYKAHNFRKK